MTNEILLGLRDNSITPAEAYQELYPKQKDFKMRRAHFVKLRIRIPEDKAVTRLLRVLFLLPVPLILVKILLKFVKAEETESLPLTKQEIYRLISYRGIKVEIKSKSGENISIKTF